jgi:hypothetical protein
MLKRLEQGGEVAQGVVRELFPGGITLYPDPEGGRFLWAHARTTMPADWLTHLDANAVELPVFLVPMPTPALGITLRTGGFIHAPTRNHCGFTVR